MPYKVLHYSDLDELVEDNDTYSGSIEDGLNAMEKLDYQLVHIIPEHNVHTQREPLYVFWKREAKESKEETWERLSR